MLWLALARSALILIQLSTPWSLKISWSIEIISNFGDFRDFLGEISIFDWSVIGEWTRGAGDYPDYNKLRLLCAALFPVERKGELINIGVHDEDLREMTNYDEISRN